MKSEIGGYIELGDFKYNPYYHECLKFNSARSCLSFLIRKKCIKRIYIPKFICDAVIDAIAKEECEIIYYAINENLTPKISFSDIGNDYFYLVNYYGQVSNAYIHDIKLRLPNLIVDNAQAFFQEPVKNIDTIYTCRKFFGVPDGAYLFSNIKCESSDFEKDHPLEFCKHIIGRLEYGAEKYYKNYLINEEHFKETDIKFMSKTADILLGAIDYIDVINKRNNNYMKLHKNLRHLNLLSLKPIQGAFAYPLMISDGDKLRKRLIKQNIFIPTLWPNNLYDIETEHFAKNILAIPCDQRYKDDDINHVIELIKLMEGK